MVKYTIQRILLAFVTAAIILTLTFLLMKQLPFYPAAGNDEAKAAFFADQVGIGNVLEFALPQAKYGLLLSKTRD